jgi:hypothetical protein
VKDEPYIPPTPTNLNNIKDRKQTFISKSRQEVERRLNCAVQQIEGNATWIEHEKKICIVSYNFGILILLWMLLSYQHIYVMAYVIRNNPIFASVL